MASDELLMLWVGLMIVALALLVIQERRGAARSERGAARENKAYRSFHFVSAQIKYTDLAPVRQALQAIGWNDVRMRTAELDYRHFLLLTFRYPEQKIVPWTGDLVTFWEQHSRDVGYGEFCRQSLLQDAPLQPYAMEDTLEYRDLVRRTLVKLSRWRNNERRHGAPPDPSIIAPFVG